MEKEETSICFYKTQLSRDKFFIIDNIQNYLGKCNKWKPDSLGYQVQYLIPTYELSIVLDLENQFNNNYTPSQGILYTNDLFPYNYMSMVIVHDGHISYYKYYFIDSYEWSSVHTIRINLVLDVLNTYLSRSPFYTDLNNLLMPTTLIERQHCDRFSKQSSYNDGNGWYLVRRVDRENEGIELPKFNAFERHHDPFNLSDTPIINRDFPESWYLIYKNTEYKPGEINERYPIEAYICYEEPLLISKANLPDNPEKKITDFFQNHTFYNTDVYVINQYSEGEVGTYFKVYLTNRYVSYKADENTSYVIRIVSSGFEVYQLNYVDGTFVNEELVLTNSDINNLTFTNCEIVYYKEYYVDPNRVHNRQEIIKLPSKIVGAGKRPGIFVKGINNIDITDVKNVKIIKLPYSPIEVSLNNGVLNYDNDIVFFEPDEAYKNIGLLKLFNINRDFLNPNINPNDRTHLLSDILSLLSQPSETDSFDYTNESKLLNSEFTEIKLMYDNVEYALPLEYNEFSIDPTFQTPDFKIGFKQTNTINSNFMFLFELTAKWDSPLAYPGYMTVKRNNETTLLTSQYLNYVNNGYNYDKKNRKMDITTGIIGNTIGLAGQGIAMATGGVSGSAGVLGAKFGSSLINDAMSTITSAIKSENAIRQRLTDMNNASVNIQGSDDIDLLTEYTDNKLWFKCFSIRSSLQKDIAFLFHLTGYSYPYREVPDFYSRYWFNFVKCKPVFTPAVYEVVPNNFVEMLSEMFKTGVTLFHEHNGYWNLSQDRENYETWLMEV